MLNLKEVGILVGVGAVTFAVTVLGLSTTEVTKKTTNTTELSVNTKEFVNTVLTNEQPDFKVKGSGLSSDTNNTTDTPSLENSDKTIKPLSLPQDRTLGLFGEVGDNAMRLALGISELNKSSQTRPIFIVIDSPGGSVLHGAHLISAMQASKAPVYTVCINLCASMAAMIHQYGKIRYATDRAMIMFHPASVGYRGDVDRIYSFIKSIQRYTNKMEVEVAKRMGKTFEQYKALTVNELWIDAEDGLAQNVVDKLVSISLDSQMFNSSSQPEEEADSSKNKSKKSPYVDIQWTMIN